VSSAVDDLPFMMSRLPFIDMRNGSPKEMQCARDRTTCVVRKWRDTRAALQAKRCDTISACEAQVGKNGIVNLVIADDQLFNRLQAEIKELSGHLASLEYAIGALNDVERAAGPGPLFFADLERDVQTFSPVETREKARIATLTSTFIARNPQMDTACVLELPEYLAYKTPMQEAIDQAQLKLEVLRPKLQSMTALLESVGC